MKKIVIILFGAFFVSLLFSCRKEETPEKRQEEVTAAAPPAVITSNNVFLVGPEKDVCRCRCEDATCICKPLWEGGCSCSSRETGNPCECTCEGGGREGVYKTEKPLIKPVFLETPESEK